MNTYMNYLFSKIVDSFRYRVNIPSRIAAIVIRFFQNPETRFQDILLVLVVIKIKLVPQTGAVKNSFLT